MNDVNDDEEVYAEQVHAPLLEAIIRGVEQARQDSRFQPFVAMTQETFERARAEGRMLREALAQSERNMDSDARWTLSLPVPETFLGYDLVVVDDLPEGVDWEWRSVG